METAACKPAKPGRCFFCYRIRLEKTAVYAAQNGYDAFSTSLLISPYQQHDVIRRMGEELAAHYKVKFFYRDFRPLFREGQAEARALGLYRQKYCGCEYSIAEKNNPGLLHEAPAVTDASVAVHPFFRRLALLTGAGVLQKLEKTKVLVFGAGGVGSWCAEALVRSGIGEIGLVDCDTVAESNVNRQIQATSRTQGRLKVDALKERLLEINPQCTITALGKMFSRENASEFNLEKADYIIDAIDTMPHKLDLIELSCKAGVRFFSSMGMALRIDPTRIRTAGIWETNGCALARAVRQGLRKRGFADSFTVVYSEEAPLPAVSEAAAGINGSSITVTAPAGMALASLVLRDCMGTA